MTLPAWCGTLSGVREGARVVVKVNAEQYAELGKIVDSSQADSHTKAGEFARYVMAREALNGDTEILQSEAVNLVRAIASDNLSATQKWLLLCLLLRIAEDKTVAHAVSGGAKTRGAPKQGMKSFSIALSVMACILDGAANTVQEAIEKVAPAHNVDARTVQKYWGAWRPMFDEMSQMTSGDDFLDSWRKVKGGTGV